MPGREPRPGPEQGHQATDREGMRFDEFIRLHEEAMRRGDQEEADRLASIAGQIIKERYRAKGIDPEALEALNEEGIEEGPWYNRDPNEIELDREKKVETNKEH